MSLPRTPIIPEAVDPHPDPGGEMTEVQAARLRELCDKLDEPFDANLTKDQADRRIEALEARLDDEG